MAMVIGYARVSTGSQSYVDQVAQLERAGAVRIFREKESGARSDRPQLAKAIASLDEGDVLLVMRLDRLARSTRDLLNIVHAIGERGAGVPVAARYLGRYQPCPRSANDDDLGGAGRVRARANPGAHVGRARPRQSTRCPLRPQAEADGASACACVEDA
jgi:hypothetical protein